MGGRKKLTPESVEAQLDSGEWLTPGAVAVLLGVDRTTVNYWLKTNQTPSGLQLRTDVDSVNQYRLCNPSDVRAILEAKRSDEARRQQES